MKQFAKRLISLMLCAAMVIGILPVDALAAETDEVTSYQPTDQAITVKAEAENTITILPEETEPSEPEEPDESDGILDIQAGTYTIERDYEQSCMIEVINNSDQTVEFYLEAVNEYPDISLEIIKVGSDESPIVIQAGEMLEVELSVFAQNAENETYSVPVTAYVVRENGYVEDTKSVMTLNCELPTLDLAWTMISEDATTLRQKWQIHNTGDTITDLVLSASGDAEDYLNFDPIVSNFELASGETFEFTVQPDLAKMENNGISALAGALVASCAGKSSSTACTFDTNGEEITVTTMGALKLQQDDNLFTKFEVVEDSLVAEWFNGVEYVSAEEISLDDIFDENGMFHARVTLDVDLGMDDPFSLGMETKATLVDEAFELDEEFGVYQMEDGTYVVFYRRLMTMEEYNAYLSEAKNIASEYGAENTTGVVSDNSTVLYSSKSDDEKYSTKALVEDIFLMDDAFSAVDEIAGGVGYTKVPGIVSDIYDVCQIVGEAGETYIVSNNPNIAHETKVTYHWLSVMKGILLGGGIAVGVFSPVVGLFFGLATSWMQDMIDDMQSQLLKDDYARYAELLDRIEGYQCTNRGSLYADFYAPNYNTNNSVDPILYVSGRMYDEGYVDRAETNYNITLNGESAGSTYTTGVTEVAMAEISTDSLKPGEVNRIEWDYDTMPGHYFVSTETEITLLYPDDTEIGYIGSPDELDDVRTKPDAAVYPENIFVETDLIAGEKTSLAFNVYNTGSKGGWFNITVADGATEIFFEENYYLSAFSSKQFSVMWTPTASTNEITVSLVNTSIDLGERDSTNNTATKTLTVREREVPVIENAYTDTVYENSTYTVSADVSSYADVTGVAFYVDGTALEGTVKSSVNSDKTRYWLTTPSGLTTGDHTGKVEITYNTGTLSETVATEFMITVLERVIQIPTAYFNSEETLLYGESYDFYVADTESLIRTEVAVDSSEYVVVEPSSTGSANYYSMDTTSWTAGEHTISVNMYYQGKEAEEVANGSLTVNTISEDDSYFSFTLDETIVNPNFRLFDEYGYSESYSMETLENGTYRFKKNLDMYDNPVNYTLFVRHDTGIIAQTLAVNHPVFSTSICNTLNIVSGDNIEIDYIDIEETNELNHSDISLNVSDTVYLMPGQYTVYMSGYYLDEYFYTRANVDLTSGNQTLYVEDMFLKYQFQIEDAQYSWYSANVYYRYTGETYWSSFYLDTSFDTESGLLTCFTADDDYIEYVENAEEVRVVVYSDAEVYVVQVKEPAAEVASYALNTAVEENDKIVKLSRDDLHAVSLVCEESGLTIDSVQVSRGDFYVTLYADVIYLPSGDYTLDTVVDTGTQTLTNEVSAMVEDDCEVVVDAGLSENLADVVVTWADQYDEFGNVEADSRSGSYISASQFASGESFKMETGYRYVYLDLYQGANRFSFYRYFENLTDEGAEIYVGNELTAVVDESFGEYDGGTRISFYLDDVQDAYGNWLNGWYIYSSQPLYGNIIFTDIDNSNHVITVPITATTLGRIYVNLPEEAGTYKMSVELYSYATAIGEAHTHTEVIDYAVNATCTTDGLTEGSHCDVCGEILVAQAVVPAYGHSYAYQNNGDGNHSVTCEKCDYCASEPHTFEENVCKDCGAEATGEHIHTYGNADFIWTDDNDACNATFTCSACGDIQVVNCEIIETTTEATCTENGVQVFTAYAQFMDKEYSAIRENVIPALGHSYEPEVTTKPTCSEKGIRTFTCSCGDTYTEEIETTGHTLTQVEAKVPTCTEAGYEAYEYCSACDYTTYKEVAATGHCYEAVVTAPTCEDKGYTTYTCICGDTYVGDEVAALGHNKIKDKGYDATCTKTGLTDGKHCTRCKKILVVQIITPALGHDWDEGAITKEPTRTEAGIKTYTCARCDLTKTEEVPCLTLEVTRIAGAGRVQTAIAAADLLKTKLGIEKFDDIILASGNNFADALAGSYLANAKGAPILLYHGKNSIAENLAYIQTNLADDGKVYILGGIAAIPESVESALVDAGIITERLQGNNRFETNMKILEAAGVADEEILICTGWNYADCLSASATGLPILMVNTNNNGLSEEQIDFLTKCKDNAFTIIGGTSAVSEAMENSIEAIVGNVDRVYGICREATSVAVAERYFDAPDCVFIAYSRNFPDGLCGGPVAYAYDTPLLLVNMNQEHYAAEYINDRGIAKGYILGGTAVVSENIVQNVFALSE